MSVARVLGPGSALVRYNGRVRPPKVLAVVSSVDLGFRYGCTPAWWQLWKGMYEAGVDLIVTPYRGPAIESPWWRTYQNPCHRQGEAFAKARNMLARVRGDTHIRRDEERPDESGTEKLTREVIWRMITPRWRDHIARILEKEGTYRPSWFSPSRSAICVGSRQS